MGQQAEQRQELLVLVQPLRYLRVLQWLAFLSRPKVHCRSNDRRSNLRWLMPEMPPRLFNAP